MLSPFLNYIKTFRRTAAVVRNWHKPVLFKFHLKKNIDLCFKDGDKLNTEYPIVLSWDIVRRIIGLKFLLKHFKVEQNGNAFLFTLPGNIKFISDSNILTDTLILIEEQYHDDLYRVKNADLKNKVVLDIGANIGDSAILFAKKGARVHSFEPVKMIWEKLEANLELNNIRDKVDIYNVALSDHYEKKSIRFDPQRTGGFSINNEINFNDQAIEEIEIVNAAEFLRGHGICKCDIIKMDVEGSETELLKDTVLIDLLEPDEIMVEYHRDNYAPLIHVLSQRYSSVERVPFKNNPQYGMIYTSGFLRG